jgi:hypothetical protein
MSRDRSNFIYSSFFNLMVNDMRYRSFLNNQKGTDDAINFTTLLTKFNFLGPKHLKARIRETFILSKEFKIFILQPDIFLDIHRIMMEAQRKFGCSDQSLANSNPVNPAGDDDDDDDDDSMPGLEDCDFNIGYARAGRLQF